MDKNNHHYGDRWVEDRLEALRPDNEWHPDTSRGLARFRDQREKTGNRKRRWGWLVASAVAAGLPLMAFPSTRAFAQRCVSACVNQSSWVREFFVGHPSSSPPNAVYVKPENRRMAPDFILEDA